MAWYWIVLICVVVYILIGCVTLTLVYIFDNDPNIPDRNYTYSNVREEDAATVFLWPLFAGAYIAPAIGKIPQKTGLYFRRKRVEWRTNRQKRHDERIADKAYRSVMKSAKKSARAKRPATERPLL